MNKQQKHILMASLILVIFLMLFQNTNTSNNIEGFTSSPGFAGLLGWPSPYQNSNIRNISLIKNAVKGKNVNDKMIGGWVLAALNNKSLWGSDDIVNTLLPGGFQPDASVMPNLNVRGSKNTFLTLGGEGVGTMGACSNERFIEKVSEWINKSNCSGICFDTEGCYGGNLNDTVTDLTNNVIPKIESKVAYPLKYILCPLGDINFNSIPKREKCKKFHFLAPMLYYGDTTYDNKGIPEIAGWIQNWKNAGWRESEIILTYQSTSAARSKNGPQVLNSLAAMLTGSNPVPLPPMPPAPSESTQRCGKNWSDANNNCHNSCDGPQDCDSSIFGTNGCYSQLKACTTIAKNANNNSEKIRLANKLFN